MPRAQPVAAKLLKVSLSREFLKKSVLDVSPDGTKLGFDYWGDPKYQMEVAEIGTGKAIFTGSFEARVSTASFTADSKAILASSGTRINGQHVKHSTIVDLETGQRIEGRHFAGNPYESDYVIALSKRILLVQHMDYDSFDRCSLVLVEFPTYREIAKVPFVIKSDEPELSMPADRRYSISDNRRIFVYCYGQTMVCRRTNDLELLWTRKIELPNGAKEVASPNENYVAVAIANGAFRSKQKVSYVSVYDGKTGAEIKRLPICGTEGLALSPDGSLLAVVEQRSAENHSYWIPTVDIHDVSSGQKVASIEHDRLDKKKVRSVYGGCTVSFTSDGRYLVTSGMHTKVWKLSRN